VTDESCAANHPKPSGKPAYLALIFKVPVEITAACGSLGNAAKMRFAALIH